MTDATDTTAEPGPSQAAGPLEKFTRQMIALREASGYSQESAAGLTRISLAFMQALEEGRMEDLPGKVFVRGFIKNLCKTYSADPTEVLHYYELCAPGVADPTTDLVPAVSRQDYKKTSNVVRLLKNKRKPSFFKQIHWQTFSKTMVLYFAVPIIGLATILLSLKAIEIETVVGWVESARSSFESAAPDSSQQVATVKKLRLPLDIALMQSGDRLEWQNEVPVIGLTAKERLVESGYVGQMARDAFDPALIATPAALASQPRPAAPAKPAPRAEPKFVEEPPQPQAQSQPQIVNSARAKVAASARVPARVAAQQAAQGSAPAEPFTATLQKVGSAAPPIAPTAARSVVTLTVLEPVKVRFKTAGKKRGQTLVLKPDTYQYPFASTLEALIFDASKVTISFNGKSLGNIGSKGRVRKITFHHKKSPAPR